MSLVVDIGNNRKIYLSKNLNNQDQLIGLWLQPQSKAITKVTDEFILKSYSQAEFENRVDVVTYEIYKTLRIGGNNVCRREVET